MVKITNKPDPGDVPNSVAWVKNINLLNSVCAILGTIRHEDLLLLDIDITGNSLTSLLFKLLQK